MISHGNPDVTHWAEVTYSDGDSFSIFFNRPFGYGQSTWEAFDAVCKNDVSCPFVLDRGVLSGIAPLDGRDWMDSEIWMLIAFDAYDYKNAIKYQACRDGYIYSAPDSKTLMDIVDKVESDPAGAKSDPEVAKHLLTDDALILRLPVCDWRHRIGLAAAYPAPPNASKVRIVPASHSRLRYVQVKGDKGGVDIYLDEDRRQIDRFVFTSPKGSFSLRPVYTGTDCPTLDRCEHFVMGFGKQQDLLDIHSLDDEPLSQSRIFEVRNTVAGTIQYNGCAGGRLYAGKNRQTVESEVKIALENPAPPRPQGAPLLGAPAMAESGDTVIPDGFCDWSARTRQMQALMKNPPPETASDFVPGAWRQ